MEVHNLLNSHFSIIPNIIHIRVVLPSQVRDHSEGTGRGETGAGGGQTTTGERSFAGQKPRSDSREQIAAAEGEAVRGRRGAQFHLS